MTKVYRIEQSLAVFFRYDVNSSFLFKTQTLIQISCFKQIETIINLKLIKYDLCSDKI